MKDDISFEERMKIIDYYYNLPPEREPAKILPAGWFWIKYNDGSGHLESPDGNKYMLYDLSTNEYMVKKNERYDFFPLIYYYIDGYEPNEFKPFDWMEEYFKEKYLDKENLDKVL